MKFVNFLFLIALISCSDSSRTTILKNANLTYEYRDNLRGDNFQILIRNNKYLLKIQEKNGNSHIQEEPITKVLQIINEKESNEVLKKYIINTVNYSHFKITEYYDKVEIETEGYVDKYEDSNDESNYRFMGEKIYAVKK